MAQKLSFGSSDSLDDPDMLDVQGRLYPLMPIGVRAVRRLLAMQKQINPNRSDDDPLTEEELDMMVDVVVMAVHPDSREAFRQHIDESVSPRLLIQIASAVMGVMTESDVDPTQPESSSDGSTPTGPASTDGAPAAALTPAL